MNFFYKLSALWNYFFSEIMLERWGCGLYTSLYGISILKYHVSFV